jgi:hypothetical protein
MFTKAAANSRERKRRSKERDDAYIRQLAEQRGWSYREAAAYVQGGVRGLEITRGQMVRERRAQNLGDVIRASEEARAERKLAGLARAFYDCDNPRCELPQGHEGPHYIRRPYTVANIDDIEQADPPQF